MTNLEINKSDRLHILLTEIQKLEVDTCANILELGKRWKEINDHKLWESMEHITSFRQFCEKEAHYSHATVYNFIGIYEKFGQVMLDNPEHLQVEPSRLIKALPYVTDNQSAEKWIGYAMQSSSEFNDFIREAQHKCPTDKCEHLDTEKDWERCIGCGKFLKPLK